MASMIFLIHFVVLNLCCDCCCRTGGEENFFHCDKCGKILIFPNFLDSIVEKSFNYFDVQQFNFWVFHYLYCRMLLFNSFEGYTQLCGKGNAPQLPCLL